MSIQAIELVRDDNGRVIGRADSDERIPDEHRALCHVLVRLRVDGSMWTGPLDDCPVGDVLLMGHPMHIAMKRAELGV